MKRHLQALKDIRNEMQFLMEHVKKKDALSRDPILARASDRSLQIIGEAAKKIPDSIRTNHPEIPWKGMIGIRDIIVHEYDEIDIEQVWQTIADDIPKVLPEIERMILKEQQN